MKWNESGFRPLLCTYKLNWARRTSWGWWDDWDDTALQTQDSKFKPWRSEAEQATSRTRRRPTILSFTSGWGNIFVSFKRQRPGNESRTLAWKAAALTTTLGPPPIYISVVYHAGVVLSGIPGEKSSVIDKTPWRDDHCVSNSLQTSCQQWPPDIVSAMTCRHRDRNDLQTSWQHWLADIVSAMTCRHRDSNDLQTSWQQWLADIVSAMTFRHRVSNDLQGKEQPTNVALTTIIKPSSLQLLRQCWVNIEPMLTFYDKPARWSMKNTDILKPAVIECFITLCAVFFTMRRISVSVHIAL